MEQLEENRKKIDIIDRQMAELFEERMKAVEEIAQYKAQNNLPVCDISREKKVIDKNCGYIKDENIRSFYSDFIRKNIELSSEYQHSLIGSTLRVKSSFGNYDVIFEKGGICKAGQLFNLNRRVLIITDSGVPIDYAKQVAQQCKCPSILTVEQGEQSKSLKVYEMIISVMLEKNFSRSDCVVAVGGGVVGDLAGFVASSYMRGVDFYNIPTTLLAQVDSSIGGKTALNFRSVKNIIGAFYPPKAVLIDTDVLKTLPKRQFACGMAEAIKMSLTCDKELFELIENDGDTEEIIRRAILIKKGITEKDEKESGLRRVLNFGHTIGHGIESVKKELFHGECVALGMLPVCSDSVRARLVPVLERYNLLVEIDIDKNELYKAMLHDKKADGETVTEIFVDEIGSYEMKKISLRKLSGVE